MTDDKPKGRPRGRSGGRKKGIGNDGGPTRVLLQIRVHPRAKAILKSGGKEKPPGDVLEEILDDARPGWRDEKKSEPE